MNGAETEGRPKKPMNGYFRFKAMLMEEFKDKEVTLNNKTVKERWDNLNNAQKEKLNADYHKELEIYKVEIEKYEKIHGKPPKKERKRDDSSEDEKPAKSKGRGRKAEDEKSLGKAKSKDVKEPKEAKEGKGKSVKREDTKKAEEPKKAVNKKK